MKFNGAGQKSPPSTYIFFELQPIFLLSMTDFCEFFQFSSTSPYLLRLSWEQTFWIFVTSSGATGIWKYENQTVPVIMISPVFVWVKNYNFSAFSLSRSYLNVFNGKQTYMHLVSYLLTKRAMSLNIWNERSWNIFTSWKIVKLLF